VGKGRLSPAIGAAVGTLRFAHPTTATTADMVRARKSLI
jgi:hypothetical protein